MSHARKAPPGAPEPERRSSLLQQFNRDQYNVLVPDQVTTQVGPWHAARITEVRVNPDPTAGDIFETGSFWDKEKRQAVKVYALSKPALMRVSAAAGLIWHWSECKPEVISRDYVRYRAVAAVRLPDGSWQPTIGTKEIDLTVIEDELREQWTDKADELITKGGLRKDEQSHYAHEWKGGGEEDDRKAFLKPEARDRYIEDHVRSALIQARKNKLQRAETGAMLRCVRALLAIKSQYTKAELEKPFIVPRIDFSPDFNDPEVRHALIEHGMRAMAGLMGQMTPAMNLPAAAIERPALHARGDDDDSPSVGAGGVQDDAPAGTGSPSTEAAGTTGDPAEDRVQLTRAEILEQLLYATQRAGIDDKALGKRAHELFGKSRRDQLTDEQLLKLLDEVTATAQATEDAAS